MTMRSFSIAAITLSVVACTPTTPPPKTVATPKTEEAPPPPEPKQAAPKTTPDETPDAADPPYTSNGTWTACMISKAELEADTGEAATIVPAGGQALALMYDLRQQGVRNTLSVTVGLPGLPSAKKMDVKGNVRHRMIEMEGGVEAGDTVQGTVTASKDPSQVDVTLSANDMLKRMFASDTSINHFTVKVVTIHHVKDCK